MKRLIIILSLWLIAITCFAAPVTYRGVFYGTGQQTNLSVTTHLYGTGNHSTGLTNFNYDDLPYLAAGTNVYMEQLGSGIHKTNKFNVPGVSFSSISGLGLNPVDFGAVGDGTTENTVAISNCVAASKALGGGIIQFPPGTFYFTNTIFIQTNQIIRGSGAISPKINSHYGTILLSSSTNKSMLFITNANYVLIENLTMWNTNVLANVGANLITQGGTVDGDSLNMEHVTMFGGYVQLAINEIEFSTFHACLFQGPWSASVILKNTVNADGGDNTWSDCTFSGPNAGTFGFYTTSSGGTRINNCKFLEYSYQIAIVPAGGNTQDFLVSNCSFEGFTTFAIDAEPGDGSAYTAFCISNCEFLLQHASLTPIAFNGGVGNYSVLGNLVFKGSAPNSQYVFLNGMTSVSGVNFVADTGSTKMAATGGSGNTYNFTGL